MKYKVRFTRRVEDVLRAEITVEAQNENDAREKAEAMIEADPECVEFRFSACGDDVEEPQFDEAILLAGEAA